MAGGLYGVDGVVEKVGPDLVEAGAFALEGFKAGREVFLQGDLLLAEFVGEDDQGCMDALVDVD